MLYGRTSLQCGQFNFRFANSLRIVICTLLLTFLFHAGYAWAITPVNAISTVEQGDNSQQKTITVGGNSGYPPYEFIDDHGKPSGFSVDLLNAIAETMGMKVDIRLDDWAKVHDGLISGKIDMTLGMSMTAERDEIFDFPTPYTIIQHGIFARKDTPQISSIEEMRGKKVIVHRNGVMHRTLEKMGFNNELVFAPTPQEGLRLLSSGEGEYAISALLPGMYVIREYKLTNLRPVANDIMSFKFSFAVKEGNKELLSKLNEGLAIIKKNGRYQEISDKWLGVLEPNQIHYKKALKYGLMLLIPLLIILGIYIYTSKSLKKRVEQRTMELAQEVLKKENALEELRHHQDKLIQADKMASLGVLVSGVAHEINNPNALILLNMQFLKDVYADTFQYLERTGLSDPEITIAGIPYQRLKKEVPQILADTMDGAKRIKRIVEDLKDFARHDMGEIAEKVDLCSVIEAAVRLVEPKIRKATKNFALSLPEEPLLARGSAQRIEQVLINIILNSCKALPDTDRAIIIRAAADKKQRTVVIQISDEGVGIPLENLSKITDPFFTTNRELGGTGLGLSISAGIISELGGTMKFDSIVGVGTTATITLPASMEHT